MSVKSTARGAANGASQKAVAKAAGQFGDFYKFQKREQQQQVPERCQVVFSTSMIPY